MEEERREHEMKMKKMEQEMEQVFEMKVKEKTQKLKDSEADVIARHLTARSFRRSFRRSFHALFFVVCSSSAATSKRCARSKLKNWNWRRSAKRWTTTASPGRTRPATPWRNFAGGVSKPTRESK